MPSASVISEGLQVVVCGLGDEEFGIEIRHVREILRLTPVTRVPRAPAFVEGIVNLRGKIIPIVDLRRRLEQPVEKEGAKARIVTVELEGALVGLIVDRVSEIRRVPAGLVERPPEMLAVERPLSRAVAKLEARLILLLDLGHLFMPAEADALSGAAGALSQISKEES